MIDPLTETDMLSSSETDKFIVFSNYNRESKHPKYMYISVIMIYIIEITTIIIGEIYYNTNGIKQLTLNRWLIVASVYNICGLMSIYQFNTWKYNNKKKLVIYECIKMIWISIGLVILFNYNKEHIIIYIYSLIYIIFESILMINNFIKLNKII